MDPEPTPPACQATSRSAMFEFAEKKRVRNLQQPVLLMKMQHPFSSDGLGEGRFLTRERSNLSNTTPYPSCGGGSLEDGMCCSKNSRVEGGGEGGRDEHSTGARGLLRFSTACWLSRGSEGRRE